MNAVFLFLSALLVFSPALRAAEQCDVFPKLASLLSPEETVRLTRMGESYENQIIGGRFLHQQNPKFHLTPEVERAAALLRDFGVKGINTPEKKIAAWIATLERTHLNKNLAGQEALRRYYQQRYIITKEEFPDSYFKLQKKIARERGYGDIEISPAQREELMRIAMEDQKHSLNPWIEHLTSMEADYPMWSRVWAFEGMGKITKVNAETGEVIRRSASTVVPFVDLNQEALSVAIEEFTKYLQAQAAGKAYTHQDAVLQELVKGGNFGKIYGRNVHLLQKDRFNRNITDGKWIRYPQGSDHNVLSNSLKNCNTGWCTDGASTAEKQLATGDFYVYYSQDPLGRPRNPRLAIRMEGDNIGEIRGIAPHQEIDPAISGADVLPKKLEEFGDEGVKYLKKNSDMKLLTHIDEKVKAGQELTVEEIRFLYEMDSPIMGFGNTRDPRIEAIKRTRNFKHDMSKAYAKAFGVSPSEVGFTVEEALSGKIKVYLGDLDLSHHVNAKDVKLPSVAVIGDVNLSGLSSAEGLVLPKAFKGELNLDGLTSAKGLVLPPQFEGSVSFSKLSSIEELIVPPGFKGRMNFVRLASGKGLIFSPTFHGTLNFFMVRSAEGLVFPSRFIGDLNLFMVSSPKGLILPSFFHGELGLHSMTSVEGLVLPSTFRGTLTFNMLTSAKGLVIPPDFDGIIHFSNLKSAEGLLLPRRLKDKVILPEGIEPTWID